MVRVDLLKDLYRNDDGLPVSLRNLLDEQEINLSDSVNIVLRDTFLSDSDDEFESYTQRLNSMSQRKETVTTEPLTVNTYLFGRKVLEVFPEFIGICSDDMGIATVLKAVQSQCEKMRRLLPASQEKTVVLLTDKWDGPMFKKKYELTFLDFGLNDNILFVFLLVTDYGVARIPFLAQNRYQLEMLNQKRYDIEQADVEVEALRLLSKFSPCVYQHRSGTWTTPGGAEHQDFSYLFDFKAGICEITNAFNEVVRKKIPKSNAQRFALTVYPLFGQPQQVYTEPIKVLDAGTCMAEVFDVRFEWPNLGVDSLSDPTIKTVSKAFARLIDSLKEM